MKALRIVAVAVFLAGAGHDARADETPSPEALAAAQELFTIVSPDLTAQLTNQMANAFWPVVEQKARAEHIDDATIAELHREFERIQLSFVNDTMKEAPAIYARHFTVGELHELTAFYRTPTGAKALHEIPLVMGEFMTRLTPHLKEVQRQMADAFSKILRDHGYDK
jgi:uncharacterized protein